MGAASLLDFAATMLAAGGAAPALDGADLTDWLARADDPATDDRAAAMFLWREAALYAVRRGRYKAHFVTRSGWNTSGARRRTSTERMTRAGHPSK